MTQVTVRRCVLRIRRNGGWAWSDSPEALLQVASRALPALVAARLPALADAATQPLDVAGPVRIRVETTVAELAALAAHPLVAGAADAAIAASALAQRVGAALEAALAAQWRSASAVPASAVPASAVPAPVLAPSTDTTAGRQRAARRVLRIWAAHAAIDHVLAGLDPGAAAALHDLVLGGRPGAGAVAPARAQPGTSRPAATAQTAASPTGARAHDRPGLASQHAPRPGSFARLIAGRPDRKIIMLHAALLPDPPGIADGHAPGDAAPPAHDGAARAAATLQALRLRLALAAALLRDDPTLSMARLRAAVDARSPAPSRSAIRAARAAARPAIPSDAPPASAGPGDAVRDAGGRAMPPPARPPASPSAARTELPHEHTRSAPPRSRTSAARTEPHDERTPRAPLRFATSAARALVLPSIPSLPARGGASSASTGPTAIARDPNPPASPPIAARAGATRATAASTPRDRFFPPSVVSARRSSTRGVPTTSAEPRDADPQAALPSAHRASAQPITTPHQRALAEPAPTPAAARGLAATAPSPRAPAVPRAHAEIEIRSVLPFLVLPALHHAGWLDTAAVLLEAHDLVDAGFALAAALAGKLVDPPDRGWRRSRDDRAIIAAFAGSDAPLADAPLAAAAARLAPVLGVLDEALRAVLAGARPPGAPVILWRGAGGWSALDTDGFTMLAGAPTLPPVIAALTPLVAAAPAGSGAPPGDAPFGPVVVPASCADPVTLERIDLANLRFITDAPPGRGEPWRALAGFDRRLWTNDTRTPAAHLAACVADLEPLLALAAELTSELDARPALARDRAAALDASASLAVTAALADTAARLFPDESTTPALALARFRDLDARVRFDPDCVRVRIPLGRRHADLMHHGLLTTIPAVPWLGGRDLDLGGA